jgi:hypothetical protein
VCFVYILSSPVSVWDMRSVRMHDVYKRVNCRFLVSSWVDQFLTDAGVCTVNLEVLSCRCVALKLDFCEEKYAILLLKRRTSNTNGKKGTSTKLNGCALIFYAQRDVSKFRFLLNFECKQKTGKKKLMTIKRWFSAENRAEKMDNKEKRDGKSFLEWKSLGIGLWRL